MIMIVMMMITLHCPMSRTLFTNTPTFSTLQNDIEMFWKPSSSIGEDQEIRKRTLVQVWERYLIKIFKHLYSVTKKCYLVRGVLFSGLSQSKKQQIFFTCYTCTWLRGRGLFWWTSFPFSTLTSHLFHNYPWINYYRKTTTRNTEKRQETSETSRLHPKPNWMFYLSMHFLYCTIPLYKQLKLIP